MYEQSRRNESEQNIPGAREEEHRHISSVQRLQATLTPLKDHLVSQWDSTASFQAKQDGEIHTPSTSPPTPLTVLSSSTVLQHATCLELVPRFYYLYAQALICAQCNGPYSLDKHKFLVYTSMPTVRLSENQLAQSLALAQDCFAATQSYHLAPEDLEIHSMLGKTTNHEMLDVVSASPHPEPPRFPEGILNVRYETGGGHQSNVPDRLEISEFG
jgi:hypothetical protein